MAALAPCPRRRSLGVVIGIRQLHATGGRGGWRRCSPRRRARWLVRVLLSCIYGHARSAGAVWRLAASRARESSARTDGSDVRRTVRCTAERAGLRVRAARLSRLLARVRRRLAIELLVVALPYTLSVAAFAMWWGGTSSAARFLTPLLLMLAIPAAVWFRASHGRVSRLLGLAALSVSVLITATIAIVDRGGSLYNVHDGMSRLLLWISPLARSHRRRTEPLQLRRHASR